MRVTSLMTKHSYPATSRHFGSPDHFTEPVLRQGEKILSHFAGVWGFSFWEQRRASPGKKTVSQLLRGFRIVGESLMRTSSQEPPIMLPEPVQTFTTAARFPREQVFSFCEAPVSVLRKSRDLKRL